jgi:hypothetical protein
MKNVYKVFSIALLVIGFGVLAAPASASAASYYSSTSFGYGSMMGGNYGYNSYGNYGYGSYMPYSYGGGYDSSSTMRPSLYPYLQYNSGNCHTYGFTVCKGSSYRNNNYGYMNNNYGYGMMNGYGYDNNYGYGMMGGYGYDDDYGYNGYGYYY